MTDSDADVGPFVAELDAAVAAHLGWTRQVLRCAVLRRSPGEDVLASDAHCRCRFGRWFTQCGDRFQALDPAATAQVLEQHRQMHDAARQLCTGLLAEGRGDAADLDRFEATQSALVACLATLKNQLLLSSARNDALTGLPLRHGLQDAFDRHRSLAQRSGRELALVLADVDHFKRVNDVHGHAVGDQALCHVAAALRHAARVGELVFRYGGEEFVLMLHADDRAAAALATDRIVRLLRDTPMPLARGGSLNLRISAGLALAGPDEPLADVVERADRAMYSAKQAGRDRWCWAEGPAAAPTAAARGRSGVGASTEPPRPT